MFKVVPDQLKISDGWVRCGHCADVFDATLYLEGEATPAPVVTPPVAAPSMATGPEPMSPSQALNDDAEGDWLLEPSPWRSEPDPAEAWTTAEFQALEGLRDDHATSDIDARLPVPESADHPDELLAPSSTGALKASLEFVDELKQFALGASKAQAETAEPESAPVPKAVATVSKTAVAIPVDPVPPGPAQVPPDEPSSADVSEPGFVREARRKAFWRSPLMRSLLASASVLLALLLVMQWAVQDRDRLAAQYPAAVPLLSSLCRPFACQLGPVRRIESVVIDSSNLVRRLGNFYSFDLVLKNSAPMAVAVPALELSLTDTRDAVVSRRVFLPDELPGAPVLLPSHGSLSMSLRLSIADSGVSSMTGYRALVFYP
ncbi:DUF3426 domain-containing protein [Hydrogenophaga sp. A37]|nr:hypothetical protein B0E41_02660 [Hydrogenophaga sp. A37]